MMHVLTHSTRHQNWAAENTTGVARPRLPVRAVVTDVANRNALALVQDAADAPRTAARSLTLRT